MAVHAKWTGHSFCEVCNQKSNYFVYSTSANPYWYLPHGWGLAWFFRKDKNGDSAILHSKETTTIMGIQSQIQELFPITGLSVRKQEYILWEEWTALYDAKPKTKSQLTEYYENVMKQHEKDLTRK